MNVEVRRHRWRPALTRLWADYKAVHERRQLLDRPWLEEVLHWSEDGELHGRLVPPEGGRPRSVTSDGWCPGQR